MTKTFLLLALAAYCLLATEGRLVKRQSNDCQTATANLPSQCEQILTQTIDVVAYGDQTTFLDTYCNSMCARPLYNYFRDCDVGSNNATMFDFYCSSNAAGNRCLPGLIAAVTSEDSFISACANPIVGTTCNRTCETALETAYDTLGCCLFSFYVVTAGQFGANAFFGFCDEDQTTLCVGGASNQTLQFPAPSVDVDPVCEEFVGDVDESCRFLLHEDVTLSAYINLGDVCGNTCGPEIYQFSRDCDGRTGASNATVLDVLCAVNSEGERCGEVLTDFSSFNISTCGGIDRFTCPSGCREAFQSAQADLGCCLVSLIEVYSGVDFSAYASIVSTACDIDIVDTCIGHFSGQPAPPPSPPEGDCALLQQSLPAECRAYTSADSLFIQAYANPASFKQNFCSSSCGRLVYGYFVQCDRMTGSHNASFVDFLCSRNQRGDVCARMYSDLQFDRLGDTCSDANDRSCSQECSNNLRQAFQYFQCCVYTFLALEYNATFLSDTLEECKVDMAGGVCVGGLSGEPVVVPGQPSTPSQPTAAPTSAQCGSLYNAIPAKCQHASNINSLFSAAYSNASRFQTEFCKSECAKPVYSYMSECVNKTDAAYIDFLCSKTSSGTDCLNIISDDQLDTAIEEGVCKDATDKQCSRECQVTIQGFSKVYGCCLFSYSALNTNVTYSNGLFDKCGVDNAGLCTGGITNAAINAPGAPTSESGAAPVGLVGSTLLFTLALVLSMFV